MVGLAVTSAARIPSMPDIATVAESKDLRGYEFGTFFALLGPAGLPPTVLDRLHRAISKIASDPDIAKARDLQAQIPPKDTSSAYAAQMMESYQKKMGRAFEELGIKPQ